MANPFVMNRRADGSPPGFGPASNGGGMNGLPAQCPTRLAPAYHRRPDSPHRRRADRADQAGSLKPSPRR
jgi:hypothetical protein